MKKYGTDSRGPRQPEAAEPGRRTPARSSLRLAATLAFAGFVVSVVAGLFHADTASANDHPATFRSTPAAAFGRRSTWPSSPAWRC